MMTHHKRVLLPLTPLAFLMLSACGGGGGPASGFQVSLPAPPPVPAAASGNGAIYQASLGYAGYHQGNRARQVGDALTILLVENVRSNKGTNGGTNRSGSFGITPPSAGPLNFLNPDALKAAASGSFKGSGSAGQSSSLTGAISVTIAEVRANGTALVNGEKQMSLSQGEEWVQFAGIIRLADVDVDNRILSTQIADSRIIYSGSGAIQQASRPGWLSRFFAQVSPF